MPLGRWVREAMTSQDDWLERARLGDGAAWIHLMHLHQGSLLRLAGAILRDEEEAKDVGQEVFRQAFQRLADFPAEGRLDLWLRRIAINLCRDLLRKRKVRQAAAEQLDAAPAPPADEVLSGRESREAILRALERLPVEHREVLVAHLLEDRTYSELAEMLDLSVNAVRIRVHRGLAALRALVKEELP